MRLGLSKNLNTNPFYWILFAFFFFDFGKYALSIIFPVNELRYALVAFVEITLFLFTLVLYMNTLFKRKLILYRNRARFIIKLIIFTVIYELLRLLIAMMLGEYSVSLISVSMPLEVLLSSALIFLASIQLDYKNLKSAFFKGMLYGGLLTALVTLALNPKEITSINRLGIFGIVDATNIGHQFALSGLVALYYYFSAEKFRNSIFYLAAYFFLAYCSFQAFSKVSLFGLILATVLMLGFSRSTVQKKIVLILILSAGALLEFHDAIERIVFYLGPQQGGQALETLTGRLPGLQESMDVILSKPIFLWLGYGPNDKYGGLNEFITTYLYFGLLGVGLRAFIYAKFAFDSLRLYLSSKLKVDKNLALLAFCFVLMALLKGVVESLGFDFIFRLPYLIAFAFVLSSASATVRTSRMQFIEKG